MVHVYVEYKVPVLVEVDLDREAIVAVYVDDEQVEGPGRHGSSACSRSAI